MYCAFFSRSQSLARYSKINVIQFAVSSFLYCICFGQKLVNGYTLANDKSRLLLLTELRKKSRHLCQDI